MRILFITNFYQLYGANRSLLSIIEYCKERGDEVCLLLPRKGDYSKELDRKRITNLVIPYFSQLLYYKKALPYLALPFLATFTLCLFPYVIYKVWRYKPDLIYSNTAAENLGILIAKILGIKHISHIREFMDLDHRCHFIFGNKARRFYINLSDGVIYVSNAVAKHVLQGCQIPENQRVIYNGVKISRDPFMLKELSSVLNFGIVGLLDESKGQHLAISYFENVLKDFPNSILHIWGDKEGKYKNTLIAMVEEKSLTPNVIFHGFEKNADVIYSDMHVLLMCSKAEGFGRVTVEAMSRGIPVIGFNSGGTAELVKDGYNGFLFQTKDEFIQCVRRLLTDEEAYNNICQQAYKDAHDNFTELIYTQKVYGFINTIMKRSKK